MCIKSQQTHLHWKRVSRWSGKSLADTHTWQRTWSRRLILNMHYIHKYHRWDVGLGLFLNAASGSVPASMKQRRSLTGEKDTGGESDRDQVSFFWGGGGVLWWMRVWGHGWRKRDGQGDNRETGQNVALGSAESQQFTGPWLKLLSFVHQRCGFSSGPVRPCLKA